MIHCSVSVLSQSRQIGGLKMGPHPVPYNFMLHCVFQVESLDDVVTPVEAILKRCNKQQVLVFLLIICVRECPPFSNAVFSVL